MAKAYAGKTPVIQTVNTDATREKMDRIRADLCLSFAERSNVIPVLMGLYLAGQNALLFGPPGTAKSAMVDAVCRNMGGGSYFRYLLTKFTTPDEVFGPRSVQGLKEDRFRRVTAGYAPEAKILFLDEIWKANSAILNSLLTLINEHEFFDDAKRIRVPMRMCVGASNELPEGPELNALYDRFAVRLWVDYAQGREARKAIMEGTASAAPSSESLSDCEIDTLTAMATAVQYDADVPDLLLDLELKLAEIGVQIGDRRRRVIYKTLPYLEFAKGGSIVTGDTVSEFLPDMLWTKPEQRSKIVRTVLEVANPSAKAAQEIVDAAAQTLANLPPKADNSDYLGRVLSAKKEIKAMTDKLLALDPNRTNGRVKRAAGELAAHYVGIMRLAMDVSGLGQFNTDGTAAALLNYRKQS